MHKRLPQEIEGWLSEGANNYIEPQSNKAAFAVPLIGFASGADPIFTFLKEDIGTEFYWTPQDGYQQAFARDIDPVELSVISWVLPHTADTKAAHKKKKDMPSIEWSCGRHYGEQVNENLRNHVVAFLAKEGIEAFAPALLPSWGRATSPKYGFASNWSERHAAYACGLGTFGLSDGLITAVGKAMRVGSVIARVQIPATKRDYLSHTAYCLHYGRGKCMACIRRCPAGAISKNGHDKVKCKKYIREITAPYVAKEQLGFAVNSCGLCQTGVPCESRNPMEKFLTKA